MRRVEIVAGVQRRLVELDRIGGIPTARIHQQNRRRGGQAEILLGHGPRRRNPDLGATNPMAALLDPQPIRSRWKGQAVRAIGRLRRRGHRGVLDNDCRRQGRARRIGHPPQYHAHRQQRQFKVNPYMRPVPHADRPPARGLIAKGAGRDLIQPRLEGYSIHARGIRRQADGGACLQRGDGDLPALYGPAVPLPRDPPAEFARAKQITEGGIGVHQPRADIVVGHRVWPDGPGRGANDRGDLVRAEVGGRLAEQRRHPGDEGRRHRRAINHDIAAAVEGGQDAHSRRDDIRLDPAKGRRPATAEASQVVFVVRRADGQDFGVRARNTHSLPQGPIVARREDRHDPRRA